MLLRNLDIQKGLCNGTRLTVKEMYENLIVADTIAIDKQRVMIRKSNWHHLMLIFHLF